MKDRLQPDKIASVVSRLSFEREVEVTTKLESEAGNAVVVRVLEDSGRQDIELETGRLSPLLAGNVVIGALGRRRALRGFAGNVPIRIRPGDQVAILNRGGVIGVCRDTGAARGPVACEVIGMPVIDGRIPNIRDARLPSLGVSMSRIPPIVVVSGTCMDSGKTSFLTRTTLGLTRRGYRVAVGKLTGVACLRDLIAARDHGAVTTASFLDFGYPSTAGLEGRESVQIARSIIGWLAGSSPDVLLLELGDGIIGDYGAIEILKDPELKASIGVLVVCAGDLVGAWGSQRYLKDYGLNVDLFSGPVTDNEVGLDYLRRELGSRAINGLEDPDSLAAVIQPLMERFRPIPSTVRHGR